MTNLVFNLPDVISFFSSMIFLGFLFGVGIAVVSYICVKN